MRKQILKRVLGFSRPYIGYLVLALISAVLSVGMTLYAPILIGRGIDQIIGPGNVDFKAILSDIAWLDGSGRRSVSVATCTVHEYSRLPYGARSARFRIR